MGRGDAFVAALHQLWHPDEEVVMRWRLDHGWHAVEVKTVAFGDDLRELAELCGGPVLSGLGELR